MALSVNQVANAIQKTAGNISQAAKALGVSRRAVYDKINGSATLQVLLADVREELVDIAESALRLNVINGDNSAIFYTLNNSPEAKRRGWGPKQEIEHSGEMTHNMKGYVKVSPDDWDNNE